MFHQIHSNSSPFTKGPWYNILHPVVSLHMIRNHKDHARRRKTWDKGFGSKGALAYHQPLLTDMNGGTNSRLTQLSVTTNPACPGTRTSCSTRSASGRASP